MAGLCSGWLSAWIVLCSINSLDMEAWTYLGGLTWKRNEDWMRKLHPLWPFLCFYYYFFFLIEETLLLLQILCNSSCWGSHIPSNIPGKGLCSPAVWCVPCRAWGCLIPEVGMKTLRLGFNIVLFLITLMQLFLIILVQLFLIRLPVPGCERCTWPSFTLSHSKEKHT